MPESPAAASGCVSELSVPVGFLALGFPEVSRVSSLSAPAAALSSALRSLALVFLAIRLFYAAASCSAVISGASGVLGVALSAAAAAAASSGDIPESM